MYDFLYLTGGNSMDKRTKEITCDEAKKMLLDAQNENTYKPICSTIILKENKEYRKIIYFNFRVLVVDLESTKQIWYEKVNGNKYFVDKVVYERYGKQQAYVEVHFRNRNFSNPNICMIRMQNEKDWEYYVGDIEDTLFYRTIEFGDIDVLFRDLEMSFESYMKNIQKCDKRFIRK